MELGVAEDALLYSTVMVLFQVCDGEWIVIICPDLYINHLLRSIYKSFEGPYDQWWAPLIGADEGPPTTALTWADQDAYHDVLCQYPYIVYGWPNHNLNICGGFDQHFFWFWGIYIYIIYIIYIILYICIHLIVIVICVCKWHMCHSHMLSFEEFSII